MLGLKVKTLTVLIFLVLHIGAQASDPQQSQLSQDCPIADLIYING